MLDSMGYSISGYPDYSLRRFLEIGRIGSKIEVRIGEGDPIK